MTATNIQPSADFRVLIKGEHERIKLTLMTTALSHASVARTSNRQIAITLGVSEYAIRRHRRLMQ